MEILRHEIAARQANYRDLVANTPIYVLGAGAVGSNLIYNLARQGFQSISVLDFDRVEQHNIGTQVYRSIDIGMLKVAALENIIYEGSEVRLETESKELTSKNIAKLLSKATLIVDGFDRSASRRAVFDYGNETGKNVVHCGLANGFGEVRWNERYIVPEAAGEDICDAPFQRNLITLTVSTLAEVLVQFIMTGKKLNYSVTLGDMKIHQD